ncbi:glycosyltransferase [Glaciihabitans sp. UYNi722]|uniref:glycosyltransferase n=1 Tax=Glaciihabitans sp. UYNi722 TaxID=3156344 RepID=UPI003394612F
MTAGLVSVVLVNFRGASDTIEAIRQLDALDWPSDAIEIIVVENDSGDDSAQQISQAAPHVNLVVSPRNLGFAGGCNLGVEHSHGEYVAFLNNDAKPHSSWVRAAVSTFVGEPRVGAVASKVLDWGGKRVDYIGAGLTWFGMGFKPFAGELVPKDLVDERDVLFGTGSAMFVRRSVFDELEGFDERYFMFFEDVDLGWRLNLLGWRFRYNPESIAFHKHHASMASLGQFKENYLLERNALFTLFKNLEQGSLDQALPAAMALSVRRAVAKGSLDSTALDITRHSSDSELTMDVAKESVASLFAIDQFVAQLPSLKLSREKVQSSRIVSDNRLWRLFGDTDAPSNQDPYYLDGYMNIANAFDVLDPPVRTRVLIITGDPIGEKLAGPAIRAWSMAEALADKHEVTLMSLTHVDEMGAPFNIVEVRPGNDRDFSPWEQWADVIIFQGHAMDSFESLQRSQKIIVADIYDPMHLEQLEQARNLPRELWDDRVTNATRSLNQQLSRADFFICASERQRLFYLGQLAALGRVNPANYAGDPDLNHLISVVPFGLSRTPPAHERDVLKNVLAGVDRDDKLLLWSGGLYNWFDPEILVQAVAVLSETRPNVRLFFQGTKHPHPGVPEMAIVQEARELARTLGVLDSSVFFNDSWVDYSDRQNYLTEADAGVSTHRAHIETTMSFRTRILDYLWAGLPIVTTEGDVFAELVETHNLGLVVRTGDVAQLTEALERVLFDEEFIKECRANVARIREEFFWDRALDPLIRFVADPVHASDYRSANRRGGRSAIELRRTAPRRKSGFRHGVSRTLFYLKNGGPRVVVQKIAYRLRRFR